jgi:uncharacterized protein
MKTVLLVIMAALTLSLTSTPHTLSTIPNPKVTDSRTHVSNPDAILQPATVNELNNLLNDFATSHQTEISVVAVESIGDVVIENFAYELASLWGIGKAEHNNGLLILFVNDQRAIRFEVGYGLEGALPDALAFRIQEQSMIPHFKDGDIDLGFINGLKHTVSLLKNEQFEVPKKEIAWSVILPFIIAAYLLIAIGAIFWINVPVKKYKSYNPSTTNIARYKALKNEKSGILLILNILMPAIGVFLVFLFTEPLILVFLLGIPIATLPANLYGKTMMWKIRRQPIPCSECDGTMHMLSEKKEDEYLKLSQQFEEQLSAVDYDVFLCKDCGNEAIFTLDKPSQYSECPKCKTKAFILHDRRVIVSPSYVNQGTERLTYKCKFCGYEEHNNNQLPRLRRTSGSLAAGAAAGTLLSGRGGFGGGGGGFGGGSFGGGRFGGGGATGRW